MNTHNVIQRTAAWHNLRRGMPTASRFGQIITPAKGKPSAAQDTLIAELIAEAMLPPEVGALMQEYVSPEMEDGIRLEDEARAAYDLEFSDGEPVTTAGFITAECGRWGGSPDALVGDVGGCEIKCPKLSTHIAWSLEGTLPVEHKCQVHGYLVITGRAWWDFFSYSRYAPPLRIRVTPDEFTASLAAELALFADKLDAARARFGLPPIAARVSAK